MSERPFETKVALVNQAPEFTLKMKKIILHIGKHKTGSTSFQLFLRKSKKELETQGIFPVPHGLGGRLAAVSIRDQMPIPPLLDMQQTGMMTAAEVTANVNSFLAGKNIETLLISSEHFSYFRTQAEITALRACLPKDVPIFVYLVVRDPEDYRISYRDHVKTTGHGPSDDPKSPYYFGKDSWLLNDEALIRCWRSEFEHFHVLDYEREGMIKKLGSAMGLPSEILKKELRLNTNSPFTKSLKSKFRKIIKKIPLGHRLLNKFRRAKWG